MLYTLSGGHCLEWPFSIWIWNPCKTNKLKKKKKINISKNIKKWKKYKTWVDNLTKIIPVNMPGFPNTYWGRRKRLAQKQIFNQICSYVFYEGVEKSVI